MSDRNKTAAIIIVASLVVLTGAALWYQAQTPDSGSRSLITTTRYYCDNEREIVAAYYRGSEASQIAPEQPASLSHGGMPTPTGSVDVSINRAPTTTLMQTISANGSRYASSDESLVFWSKGNTALIMRNNRMDLNYTNCSTEPRGGSHSGEMKTYTNEALGLQFEYASGSDGYVIREIAATSDADLVRTIVLMRAKDAQAAPPQGGEGPPTITIGVYKNTQKQFPQAWAETHPQYSAINLKTSPVTEAVVGGANAIRYMADGLYASENYIVAHGSHIYVLSGMFLDQDSDLHRDFAPLVQSIRFISAPGQ